MTILICKKKPISAVSSSTFISLLPVKAYFYIFVLSNQTVLQTSWLIKIRKRVKVSKQLVSGTNYLIDCIICSFQGGYTIKLESN